MTQSTISQELSFDKLSVDCQKMAQAIQLIVKSGLTPDKYKKIIIELFKQIPSNDHQIFSELLTHMCKIKMDDETLKSVIYDLIIIRKANPLHNANCGISPIEAICLYQGNGILEYFLNLIINKFARDDMKNKRLSYIKLFYQSLFSNQGCQTLLNQVFIVQEKGFQKLLTIKSFLNIKDFSQQEKDIIQSLLKEHSKFILNYIANGNQQSKMDNIESIKKILNNN
jgi:hypothetical protein